MIRINDNLKRYLISLLFGIALGMLLLTILRKFGILKDSWFNLLWIMIPIWVVNYKDKIFK